MDELLKQALCSIGITYLVIGLGRWAISLVMPLITRGLRPDAPRRHSARL